MCEFVPVELIVAVGATPYRMCTGLQETTFSAEEYLPQTFCPLIKSTMGAYGEKPPFDLVVIPATCDGRKHLGELYSDDVNVHMMDVPITGETVHARMLWMKEVQRLRKALQSTFDKKITAKGLKRAILEENGRRELMAQLLEQRKGDLTLSGSDLMLVALMSRYMDVDRWSKAVNVLIASGSKRKTRKEGRTDRSGPRILLTGAPVILPNWKIPLLIEESGGALVLDSLCSGTRTMWQTAEPSGWSIQEMMIAMADRQMMSLCPCQIPFDAAWARIRTVIEDFQIDGIIHHVLQSCHPFGVEATLMRRRMEELDVPLLSLETDYSQEDVEQLRTRIEAFIEMLEGRSNR